MVVFRAEAKAQGDLDKLVVDGKVSRIKDWEEGRCREGRRIHQNSLIHLVTEGVQRKSLREGNKGLLPCRRGRVDC
jgi:hypothetical protein